MPRWLLKLNEYVPIRYGAWAFSMLALLAGLLVWRYVHADYGLALAAVGLMLTAVGVSDVNQTSRSVLRNYPVIGHLRYLLEFIRPEMRQYFIEGDNEAAP